MTSICTRRRGLTIAIVLSTLALMATAVAPPAHAETNINFLLGRKFLDKDDWPVGDNQGTFAIQSTFGPKKWPVSIAIDAVGSGHFEEGHKLGDNIKLSQDLVQSTFELDVGVRKIWQVGKARPFVGGGLAIISGRQEAYLASSIELPELPGLPGIPEIPDFGSFLGSDDLAIGPVIYESDAAAGVWIDGGVFWRLTKHLNLGFEARYSRAELDLLERGVQAGGTYFGLLLGWGW